MTLNSDVQTLLEQIQAAGVQPFHQGTPEQARALVASFTNMQNPAQPVKQTIDIEYQPGTSLRIYIPDAPDTIQISDTKQAKSPVIVYYHGGGFVAGSLDVADESCRTLANANGAIVVSIDYRLAPEHPFPAVHVDAQVGLQWVIDHISDYQGDTDKITIMGDSAGGNLAATTALWAAAKGIALHKQVLIYPVIQPELPSASRCEANGYLISQADMDWFWHNYQVKEDAINYSPLQYDNLAQLPPTLIITTEYEVSRDDAEYYAQRLIQAGVSTQVKRILGGVHGIFWLSAAVPLQRQIHEEISAFLR